jgi:Ca2+-binding RTX toxin-like protein
MAKVEQKKESMMKKKLWQFGLCGLFVFCLITSPSQASFVQCPGGTCVDDGQTDNADMINGTPDSDFIIGLGGNDIIFGGPGNDFSGGEDAGVVDLNQGSDIIFGGPGSDVLDGDEGDDILLAGPDDGDLSQEVEGGNENDVVHVFAGDVTTCLFIDGSSGFDTVNLIGFGPFIIAQPFSNQFTGERVVHVVDPIGGGDIFIEVQINGDGDTELINGLPTPNATFLPDTNPVSDACPEFPQF